MTRIKDLMQLWTLPVSTALCFCLTNAAHVYLGPDSGGKQYRRSYEGRHFLLALPTNFVRLKSSFIAEAAFISTDGESAVKIMEPTRLMTGNPKYRISIFIVRQGKPVTRLIPDDQKISTAYTGCAMIITSSADIIVQVTYIGSQSSDMFQLPPVNTYGTRFGLIFASSTNFILVYAAYEYTEVKYHFPVTKSKFVVQCAWNTVCSSSTGQGAVLYLNSSTYSYVVGNVDISFVLTGTLIVASKPVLVMSGVSKQAIDGPFGLAPVYTESQMSNNYIVIADYAGSANMMVLKVLSRKDLTCTLHKVPTERLHLERLKRYGFYEQYTFIRHGMTFCSVSCQGEPFYATMYSANPAFPCSVVSLIPNELWPSTAYFVKPHEPMNMDYHLYIIAGRNQMDHLMCNGTSMGQNDWKQVDGASSFSYLRLNLGRHFAFMSLIMADPRLTFAAYVKGDNQKSVRLTNLGSVFKINNEPCQNQTRYMKAGDNIDNDCDGTIDEELTNGLDDDNDTLVDEDTLLDRVNGGWGSWIEFYCDADCKAKGHIIRRRVCNNPKPKNQGERCKGNHEEIKGTCLRETTESCTKDCELGRFSPSCQAFCSKTCSPQGCRRMLGTCYSCVEGIAGEYCTKQADTLPPKYQPISLSPDTFKIWSSITPLYVAAVILIVVLAVIALCETTLRNREKDEEDDPDEGVMEETNRETQVGLTMKVEDTTSSIREESITSANESDLQLSHIIPTIIAITVFSILSIIAIAIILIYFIKREIRPGSLS